MSSCRATNAKGRVVLERRGQGTGAKWVELWVTSDCPGAEESAWGYIVGYVALLERLAKLLWGKDGDDGELFDFDSSEHDSSDAEGYAEQLNEIAELARDAGVTGRP